MDTGKAIFLGLALIALAIFANDALRSAHAGIMGSGRYMGVGTNGKELVWVIDTETGKAKVCLSNEGDCLSWYD